jgi:hypothetical protein
MVHGVGGDGGGDVTIECRASADFSRVRQKNSLNGVLDLTV